jgi:hypothetical protein
VIKLIIYLLIAGALAYCGATVKLGKRTFFGHVRAIWHTEEMRELKDGIEDKAGPTADKLKKGAEAGYKAMKEDGSAGSGAGSALQPRPHTP